MSQEATQFLVAALFSLCLGSFVYRTSRKGRLSFQYTIGWLGLCGLGIFAGLLIPVLTPLSRILKMTPAALIAVGVLVVVLIICIQLTIAISSLEGNVRKLAERIAHLDEGLSHVRAAKASEEPNAE